MPPSAAWRDTAAHEKHADLLIVASAPGHRIWAISSPAVAASIDGDGRPPRPAPGDLAREVRFDLTADSGRVASGSSNSMEGGYVGDATAGALLGAAGRPFYLELRTLALVLKDHTVANSRELDPSWYGEAVHADPSVLQ